MRDDKSALRKVTSIGDVLHLHDQSRKFFKNGRKIPDKVFSGVNLGRNSWISDWSSFVGCIHFLFFSESVCQYNPWYSQFIMSWKCINQWNDMQKLWSFVRTLVFEFAKYFTYEGWRLRIWASEPVTSYVTDWLCGHIQVSPNERNHNW